MKKVVLRALLSISAALMLQLIAPTVNTRSFHTSGNYGPWLQADGGPAPPPIWPSQSNLEAAA